MAGHSKWANIKHKKSKTDAQRAKIFTKLGREIQVAVREGGPDPETNSRLKDVIAKAKANNMPNDNIQRSIKKASGVGMSDNMEEITYEGYGPSGVAVIVEAVTDNRNRTAGEMRHYFDKYGGNLGATNCVSFMFDRKGIIVIEDDGSFQEDELMMEVLEMEVEDFSNIDGAFEIVTSPAAFSKVRDALEKKGYKFAEASITMVPQSYVELENEEDREKFAKLIEALEDNDDVIEVYHNYSEE
jgi:YebC/PmpR family DNA-binding regulatory protein